MVGGSSPLRHLPRKKSAFGHDFSRIPLTKERLRRSRAKPGSAALKVSPVKVLASRIFPGPAWEELEDVEFLEGPLPDALGEGRPDVEALAVVAEQVDDRTLDLLPNLRVVANYGVGYDDIDVAACARRGVAVTNTPGVLDAATADLAFALVLAVRRRLVEADAFVRSGRWASGWAEPELLGDDVAGATIGIVGLGRIGQAVARRARGFDMRVLYARRNRLAPSEERELEVEYRPLDDLLAEADVVTLHVPLTEETRGLIEGRRLALMRPGACLVNTARGQVVDEEALVEALVAGRLRAGLDVFAHEPRVPRALLDLPNVVLTPHIASATAATREAMTRVLVDNLLAARDGRELPNRVYP
ncbi:MAG TPA: D-glycerate dehydrogenase [Gaiellaceae bacterium]|nr:D-glycerate dehydrogenase [Gaiellaceae bacterium]